MSFKILNRLLAMGSGMLLGMSANAQKPSISLSGSMGVTYEGYGLTVRPQGSTFYTPRRPWNQVRFNIAPKIEIGGLSLPFNLNFATKPTNFAGPMGGI
ncbi:MAG TPA: hypothetical protein VKH37_08760, partial [Ferruginibacter sp.]|nr:hypothetical protein [Ferruginibacter sp.]